MYERVAQTRRTLPYALFTFIGIVKLKANSYVGFDWAKTNHKQHPKHDNHSVICITCKFG